MRHPVLPHRHPRKAHARGGRHHRDRLVDDARGAAIGRAPEGREVESNGHHGGELSTSAAARSSDGANVIYTRANTMAATEVLYRAFYDHVLSRLPEQTAVRMGQSFLRALPLDRLPLPPVEHPLL